MGWTRVTLSYLLGLFLTVLFGPASFVTTSSVGMKNVTDQVFGPDLNLLPVAFGDFNGDNITDLFVLDPDRSKVSVMLAKEDTFSASTQYFAKQPKPSRIECAVNGASIQAVLPGDFDGDGGMDALIVLKNDDEGKISKNKKDVMF